VPFFLPNRGPGRLIVVEGIDGSGKSTQIALLSQWLRLRGYAVAFSEWNSSPLVKETTRRGKKKEMFTPTSFSLIHATDFADRMERYILPLLKAGAVVCADRYAYTAFARDIVRGVDRAWVRNLYRFALKPDLAFYFKVPLETALGRILGGRNALKYYEAGMDLGLSRNIEESFRIFQGRILAEYESMIEEMGFHVIDATKSIESQQKEMRRIVLRECVIAYGILLVFMLGGRTFLQWLQLSEESLAIAGGTILFLIALRMVFAHPEGVFGESATWIPTSPACELER